MAEQPSDPNFSITDVPSESQRGPKPIPETQKAVAISYDRREDDAPKVIASGSGAVADQILKIAFDRGIKVREDAELVEILSLIEVDSPIPLEAFTAVAEILAYVYEANAGAKQRALKE